MSVSRQMATAFVESYGQTWQSWDYEGFVDLFSDDVVYVEHPVQETVVGRDAMARYIRRDNACGREDSNLQGVSPTGS